jgi:hypothetical protein
VTGGHSLESLNELLGVDATALRADPTRVSSHERPKWLKQLVGDRQVGVTDQYWMTGSPAIQGPSGEYDH